MAGAALPPQVRDWLSLQRFKSVLPRAEEMLVETFPRASKHYLVAYPFEGRHVHVGISALLAWLLAFSAIAMMAMPLLMYVLAPGFSDDPPTFDLAVDLTQICFPYLLFMSLTALQSGVLNSLNRFTAAAAAPILLNIVMIASNGVAWFLATGNTPATGYIFAWGLFAAGIAQYALLAVACRAASMRLVPRWPMLTPDVKRVIRLSVPGIISGGIMQINLLIATMIATTIPTLIFY